MHYKNVLLQLFVLHTKLILYSESLKLALPNVQIYFLEMYANECIFNSIMPHLYFNISYGVVSM